VTPLPFHRLAATLAVVLASPQAPVALAWIPSSTTLLCSAYALLDAAGKATIAPRHYCVCCLRTLRAARHYGCSRKPETGAMVPTWTRVAASPCAGLRARAYRGRCALGGWADALCALHKRSGRCCCWYSNRSAKRRLSNASTAAPPPAAPRHYAAPPITVCWAARAAAHSRGRRSASSTTRCAQRLRLLDGSNVHDRRALAFVTLHRPRRASPLRRVYARARTLPASRCLTLIWATSRQRLCGSVSRRRAAAGK